MLFRRVPISSPIRRHGGIGMKDQEEKLSARQTHGVKALKRAVRTLGGRSIDKRTRVGKRHAHLRDSIIGALGGSAVLTPQKRVLVDEMILTKLMLDSVNAWIVAQPCLINKRNKSVIAAVKDRNTLVNVLRMLLGDLGLERHTTLIPSLTDYLEVKRRPTKPPGKPSVSATGPDTMTTQGEMTATENHPGEGPEAA